MFYSPWYLLLLLLVPVIGWRMFRRPQRTGIRFSSIGLAIAYSRR